MYRGSDNNINDCRLLHPDDRHIIPRLDYSKHRLGCGGKMHVKSGDRNGVE